MMTLLSTGAPPPAPPSETSHPKHPEHKLTLVPTGQAKFECKGCHEHGTGGKRYTCLQPSCDFDLHQDCALTKLGARFEHELLKKITFEFCFEAPRSMADRRLCDACGAGVLGFHYHCSKKNLDLHPCCAKLPLVIQNGELTFELRDKVSHRCSKCKEGGGVRDFWFYRSTCKTVYLHVRCVKEVFLLSSSSSTGPDVRDDGRLGRYVKETALQKHRSGKAGRNFDAICEIVKAVVGIILAVLTGNPVPLIPAVIDLARNCTKMKIG